MRGRPGSARPGVVAGIVLAVLLGAGGCKDEEKARRIVARDVETFTNDQCMKPAITDAERERLVLAAKEGRITETHVKAYLDALDDAVENAQKTNMGIDRFCPLQQRIFRKHLRP